MHLLVLILNFMSIGAWAVTPVPPVAPPSAFPMKVYTQESRIEPMPQILQRRIRALRDNPEAADELIVIVQTQSAVALAQSLANEKKLSELNNKETRSSTESWFKKNVFSRIENKKFQLRTSDLDWLDLEKLSKILSQKTINAWFSRSEFAQIMSQKESTDEFLQFLKTNRPGLSQDQVFNELSSVFEGPSDNISLTHFLPKHMNRIFGHYSPLKGRNCFLTALSFADQGIEKFSSINVVRETNHHKYMINSDEFHNALRLGYSELSEIDYLEGLRLGDLVVFRDTADGEGYQSFRHAAVHVAGNVYLHKQSKSASSPIEFTTWEQMAGTWTELAKSLGVSFFRRLPGEGLSSRTNSVEKIEWSR